MDNILTYLLHQQKYLKQHSVLQGREKIGMLTQFNLLGVQSGNM